MKNIFLLLVLTSLILISCQKENQPIEQVLENTSPKIQAITSELEKHKVQLIYTKISRDENGKPIFEEHDFQLDENQYFYPASTAKLPVALLAVQRVNELNAQGVDIDINTPFEIKTKDSLKVVANQDSTSVDGKITVAHLIKKIFLVSDNDAYNYLFDFLGRDYINSELKKKGYQHSQIVHKFLSGADNENTWEYTFFKDSIPVYHQASIKSSIQFNRDGMNGLKAGVGFTDNEGNLTQEPFDFSMKNSIALKDLNRMVKAVIFPETFADDEQFNLTESDYEFLRFWMSRLPSESEYPNYKDDEHYDSYVKFFVFGDDKSPMPKDLRIYNKVGYAYGTLTDVAYVKDEKNDIEFMLSGTILVNENQIFNDGNYEYEEKGIPFLAEFGRLILENEIKNK